MGWKEFKNLLVYYFLMLQMIYKRSSEKWPVRKCCQILMIGIWWRYINKWEYPVFIFSLSIKNAHKRTLCHLVYNCCSIKNVIFVSDPFNFKPDSISITERWHWFVSCDGGKLNTTVSRISSRYTSFRCLRQCFRYCWYSFLFVIFYGYGSSLEIIFQRQ